MYHLVWIPKYRKRVLKGEIARTLKHLIYEAVKVNWWWVEELKILSDHVHMLIQIHLDESVSEVVQRLKGGTSRVLRQEYPELTEFVWGDSFWADGYFAETIGERNVKDVKAYIKENKESMSHADE